jgi:pimeloyl-ACP methyl ester carboxylesterase
MGNIQSKFISIEGATIHYLEAGKENKSSVLFLHGASFKAQTWQDLGTLNIIVEKGYRAIALDLPGYGNSQRVSMAGDKFLLMLLEKLNIDSPIIISPSMSGGYSLPLVANYPDQLTGFVAVAPVAIAKYAQQLKGVKLPTLAIWGSNDSIVPIKMADELIELMPNATKVILTNAGHACYLKATAEFHDHLREFIDSLYVD